MANSSLIDKFQVPLLLFFSFAGSRAGINLKPFHVCLPSSQKIHIQRQLNISVGVFYTSLILARLHKDTVHRNKYHLSKHHPIVQYKLLGIQAPYWTWRTKFILPRVDVSRAMPSVLWPPLVPASTRWVLNYHSSLWLDLKITQLPYLPLSWDTQPWNTNTTLLGSSS